MRQSQHRILRNHAVVVNHVNIEGARAPTHQALTVMRRLHRITQLQQLVGTQVSGHLNDRVHEIRLTRRATHRGGTVQPGGAHQPHTARHQVGDGTLQGVFTFAQVRA